MISIYKEIEDGFEKVFIQYNLDDKNGFISLYSYEWDRSIIIDKLIRNQYPQDKVEAIINNHFLNISEWLDKKFKGEEVVFEDPEYDELQNWRKQCKVIADEALTKYPI